MDLQCFQELVDTTSEGISSCNGHPQNLYEYVGLEYDGNYQSYNVSNALYENIKAAVTSGVNAAQQECRSLLTDLIREHVVNDRPLEPYFEVLRCLCDALRTNENRSVAVVADWPTAVKAACDHIVLNKPWAEGRSRLYAREYAVARAARRLQDKGYPIILSSGSIRLDESGETALVKEIERLVASIGGLNLARRIFSTISANYDAVLQRYHLIPHISLGGDGTAQVPWNYLLQLAVKHLDGVRPYANTNTNWERLVELTQAYAAVYDVQPYAPIAIKSFDPQSLLQYMREIALYDTMFRMPQLRPSDVLRLCQGLLGFKDGNELAPDGWCLNQVFEIIEVIFSKASDIRGPIIIAEADLCRSLPHIPKNIISIVLDEILSHPLTGANQNYSRPTDVPTTESREKGIDFIFRPLLRQSGRSFLMIDRSVCAAACVEALFSALRPLEAEFENKVGLQAERFLKDELAVSGVCTQSGDYDACDDHGECDIVIETIERVIFFEVKKKPLTRKARAGNDVDLLLDLAGSMLAAQAQAGWHEVRLRKQGHLELEHIGQTYSLCHKDREIERVAVALLDYGSFQDRIFLSRMLETNLGVNFSPTVPNAKLKKRFDTINETFTKICDQLSALQSITSYDDRPFFHCWFLSIPQILVLLDEVTDVSSLWEAFHKVRYITTGTNDFYYELSQRRI